MMFTLTPMVKKLFVINVIVFIIEAFLPTSTLELFSLHQIDHGFNLFQLLSYQFLHANLTHIFFNMLAFVSLAPSVENILGPKKFLTFYLICGIVAGLFGLWLETDSMVGASGSIFGVVVMFAFLFPNEKLYVFFLFGVRSKYLVSLLVAFEIYSQINKNTGDNVSHAGHIGGAVAGFILIINELFRGKLNKNEHTGS